MDATNSLGLSQDELFGEAANEFFAEVARGEQPSLSDFAKRYPEIAEHIRRTFPALLLVGTLSSDDEHINEMLPEERKTLGDFRLIREIGRGGMGTVFEAEQLSMGRRVALKVLPFAALVNETSLQRFRNEVRAAAALNHPHIVPVYSIGEERGIHFYAMQLIRGRTLADMIHVLRKAQQPVGPSSIDPPASDDMPTIDSSTISPPATKRVEQARISTLGDSRQPVEHYGKAARLGIQGAEALKHAHDQGVLHRDIKPGNLLLDGSGDLYVTDFGLARIESDAGMTMTGNIVGTLRYMAPEQALAKRVVIDHRADIYSLGATLYELLTLQPAFSETDRSELLKQIAFQEPRPLRKLDRHIPAELETIVLRAMAKNPDERYQTSQQLADDLRAFIENRPIRAKPPTWREQIVKWSRRHPTAVWAAMLFLLMTTIVSAASAVIVHTAYQRESLAREFAEEQQQRAEAERQRTDKNFARARNAIDRFLASPAGGKDIWFQLSPELRKKFAKAATDYYQTLVQEGSSEPALKYETAIGYRSLAQFQDSMSNYEQGEKLITKSIAILDDLCKTYPNDFIYQSNLAWAYLVLRGTLAAENKLPAAEAAGEKSFALYTSLIREDPGVAEYIPEIERSYDGLMDVKRRRHESTEKLSADLVETMREVERRFPSRHDVYNALGMGLLDGGHVDDAIAAFREDSRLNPQEPAGRVNLGECLVEKGRFEEAVANFREAIRLRPDDPTHYLELGKALEQMGQFEKAIDAFREAVRLRPESPEYLDDLAWRLATYPDEKLRDPKAAIGFATKTCELNQYKIHLDTLACAYAAAGDFQSAIKWGEQARGQSKDDDFRASVALHIERFRAGKSWSEDPRRSKK